jgi:hypothetical protein
MSPDDSESLHGALERRDVKCIDTKTRQQTAMILSLRSSGLVQIRVFLSLHPRSGIPFGLTVADEVDGLRVDVDGSPEAIR